MAVQHLHQRVARDEDVGRQLLVEALRVRLLQPAEEELPERPQRAQGLPELVGVGVGVCVCSS